MFTVIKLHEDHMYFEKKYEKQNQQEGTAFNEPARRQEGHQLEQSTRANKTVVMYLQFIQNRKSKKFTCVKRSYDNIYDPGRIISDPQTASTARTRTGNITHFYDLIHTLRLFTLINILVFVITTLPLYSRILVI
jgi:hypothetical protein